jgi:hypothetical protein
LLALVTLGTGAIGPEVYALAAAALVLAIGSLAIGALLLGRRGRLPRTAIAFATWTGVVAAVLSLGAAAIHFAVINEHFAEYPPYGVAFTAFAWFQVGWGVVYVVRPNRGLVSLAIVINLGALFVWAISRVVGLPIGPQPGTIEATGALDQLAGALEVTLIGILVWDLTASTERFRPRLSPSMAFVYVGSAILAVVVLTSTAIATTSGSSHSGASHNEPTASGEPSGGEHSHESPSASAVTPAGTGPAAASAPGAQPGAIVFGSGLDLTGAIQDATTSIRAGQKTTWLVELREPPNAPTLRFMIFQVLPDGREVEHWRQELVIVDPGGRELVGMADLSIYVHGGAGSYRMRYFRGTDLLAEGAFEFSP